MRNSKQSADAVSVEMQAPSSGKKKQKKKKLLFSTVMDGVLPAASAATDCTDAAVFPPSITSPARFGHWRLPGNM